MTRNIYQKINDVMAEVRSIAKSHTVGYGNFAYKATTHDQVTAMLREPMRVHGIAIEVQNEIVSDEWRIVKTKNGEREENFVCVKTQIRYINTEEPNDFIICVTFGKGTDTGDKSLGKAMSYSQKYNLLKTFMLATGEDSDLYPSPENDQPQATNSFKKQMIDKATADQSFRDEMLSYTDKNSWTKFTEQDWIALIPIAAGYGIK